MHPVSRLIVLMVILVVIVTTTRLGAGTWIRLLVASTAISVGIQAVRPALSES